MLEDFEGQPVARASVKITRAGDGLSEAMKLAPEALQRGEEVFFVLRGVVDKVTFEPIPKADGYLSRVHIVAAQEVARVDKEGVAAFLKAEADRLSKLREEQQGVSRLPLGEEDPLNVFDREPAE